MSHKSKGINAERELIHLFWGNAGWAAIRVAGSGAIKYPAPDIVAGNAQRTLAIECKSTKSRYQYLEKESVAELAEFATRLGAEPWIAVRFNRDKWYFLEPKDLIETKNQYAVNFEFLKNKGITFESLINKKQ